ncbi:DUF721 domain-containing protein [Aureicoccus marinus]|jgi:predicted nucleic acid-binding Zn ribbon protein|uniref:RNA-binding protein n=1 Tax=Aureicoccus marinus TaxID=754435 RepID=A0A2S7T459_9FLAO|nr:DUF721 domain-containing protein [Aureicoccus marinus]PQJ14700.1 hypothetical protein BST99_02140 [Aureicoccus marinus]
MNPKEEFRLSNKMQEFLQNTRLEKGLNKVRAEHAWTEQMGPGIANYTQEVWWHNGCLNVRLTSAPLRQELLMGKSKIIKLLNEHLGEELIQELKLL